MSYIRFGLMILTSTVVMYLLMYLNTFAWEHVFFSETRAYMAVMMGATMAIVMLAYMLGMYPSRRLNTAIFAGAVIVFGVMLWLVRSQVTVSGPSFMRAMIPHHSIAIMVSERAQIRDPRVRHLADAIIEAQRREIAEMRYLIAETAAGNVVDAVYQDPPARTGTVADALSNTMVSQLHLAPVSAQELEDAGITRPGCTFNRSPEADPVLWTSPEAGTGAIKLNGVVVHLAAAGAQAGGSAEFSAPGARLALRQLGDEADWRQEAELVLDLDQGRRVGYRGFFACTN